MAEDKGMDKTAKLKHPLAQKSVPVRCNLCGKLVEISKCEMDESETSVSHKLCYDCFKAELKKLPSSNKVIKNKQV